MNTSLKTSSLKLDSQSVIQTKNLCKTYGDKDTLVKALDNVTLDIKAGEFSAIVGPSGSGKSTLLQMIGGLDEVDSGEIYLAGNNIADLSSSVLTQFRRDHIGFIFQSYNLIPVLSAAENVEYIMLLQGIEKAERKERTFEILKQVGLIGRENRRPGQLSGGQQQRVAVARAMVSKPDIILADEPTANLDSKTGIELLDMMKELNEVHKMTFLFSTHDPKIMDRATRLIQMVDGKLTN